MKNYLIHLSLLILLCVSQFTFADTKERLDRVNWKAFSKNLLNGLAMENDGVRQAVMQNIIKYSDRLDVEDGVFKLVNIYRNHPDEKFRQLAVVTLGKIQNKWAMKFLKNNLEIEENPVIRHQITHCLCTQNQPKLASIMIEIENLIAEREK
jgi:hypothetical protein